MPWNRYYINIIIVFLIYSLSCEPENINDHIVIFKWIFFAKVSIIFGVPETACTHMKTAVSFLQNNHISCKLEFLINFLKQFDDYLTCVITPFLSFFRIIVSYLECFKDQIINLFFNCWTHFLKCQLYFFPVSAFIYLLRHSDINLMNFYNILLFIIFI